MMHMMHRKLTELLLCCGAVQLIPCLDRSVGETRGRQAVLALKKGGIDRADPPPVQRHTMSPVVSFDRYFCLLHAQLSGPFM